MKFTVNELMLQLEQFDKDAQIVLSHDAEGNGYSENIEVSEESGIVVVWPSSFVDFEDLEDFTGFDDEEDVE